MDQQIADLTKQVQILTNIVNTLMREYTDRQTQQIRYPLDLASKKTIGFPNPISVTTTPITQGIASTPATIHIASGTLLLDTSLGIVEVLLK